MFVSLEMIFIPKHLQTYVTLFLHKTCIEKKFWKSFLGLLLSGQNMQYQNMPGCSSDSNMTNFTSQNQNISHFMMQQYLILLFFFLYLLRGYLH